MPSWPPGSDCRKCLRRGSWSRLTFPRSAANGAVTARVTPSDLFRTYRPQTSVRLTRWVMTQTAKSSARARHSPATRSRWSIEGPSGEPCASCVFRPATSVETEGTRGAGRRKMRTQARDNSRTWTSQVLPQPQPRCRLLVTLQDDPVLSALLVWERNELDQLSLVIRPGGVCAVTAQPDRIALEVQLLARMVDRVPAGSFDGEFRKLG